MKENFGVTFITVPMFGNPSLVRYDRCQTFKNLYVSDLSCPNELTQQFLSTVPVFINLTNLVPFDSLARAEHYCMVPTLPLSDLMHRFGVPQRKFDFLAQTLKS